MATAAKIKDRGFEDADVFVGKDVLELLSSSMYVNPLSIFREYVQNATDAVDDAVAFGLLPSTQEGKIEINLDHIDRRVVIRDNGCGLSNASFTKRMLSFGASDKRGTDARGFRGVGRLSALGYVQKLVFRSRSKGDVNVLEVTWDGRAVKQMLASTDKDADLRTIVGKAVSLRELEPADYPPHFFEVELVKPRRIANDRLLNELEIEAFIGQVCPCPFSPEFSYGHEIADLLLPHGRAGRSYNIHINESEVPVYRPYRDDVSYSDTKKASLRQMKPFEVQSIDGDVAAVGWLVHHDYQGAIPASQGVRGLRARVGNIQVGHDRLFLEVFPEDRFCSWTIGEVHVLDARVVPNGRRDEFEGSTHLDNIIAHLRPLGAEVARECRLSSQKRNRLKIFELGADKIYEKLEVMKQGAVTESFAKAVKSEISKQLYDMQKVVEFDLFEDEEQKSLRGKLAKIEGDVDAVAEKKNEGDVFDNLPAKKRATYKEVIELIYECSANQVAAKSLIDRMLDRLSRS